MIEKVKILREVRTLQTYKSWLKLIMSTDPIYVYKYIPLDIFLTCIRDGMLRLNMPTVWPDKYECHFYNARYDNVTSDKSKHPFVFAYCVTSESANEAAWKQYRKLGPLGNCVQLKIYVSRLRDAIYEGMDKKGLLYIGTMDYRFSEYDIQKMHMKDTIYYPEIFNDFTLDKYIHLLLLKRKGFKYESEIRYIWVPNESKPFEEHLDIRVNWPTIVKSILIDPEINNKEFNELINELDKCGFNQEIINEVKKVDLYGDPNSNIIIE